MTSNGFTSDHFDDADGNPSGGCAFGVGFTISWQRGPLGRGDGRKLPNGAFVEDLIAVVIDRLAYYQRSKFACNDNQRALEHLRAAAGALAARTVDREERAVEGTHQP